MVIVHIDLSFREGAGTDFIVESTGGGETHSGGLVVSMVIVLIDLSFCAGAGTDLSVERPIVATETESWLLFTLTSHFLKGLALT